MFGLFLKAARPRYAPYGAVVMLAAAGAAHYAGMSPINEPMDEVPTASITPAAPPVAVPLPVPRPQLAVMPRPAPASPAKRQFITYDGRDMGGGDYAVLQGVSHGVCETRCLLDRQCVSYTFNKWEDACFLKSSLSDLRFEPRGISGVLSSAKVATDPRTPIIQKAQSRRLEGKPYRQVEANFGGCAQACLADDKCAGFNLPAGGQFCSLMTTIDTSVAARGMASGLKIQLARKIVSRDRRSPWPPADIPPEFATFFDAVVNQALR